MLKLILQNLLFIQKILIIMEKVLRKVANGNFLLKSEEKKLFTLQAEKRKAALLAYIKNWRLATESELKLFELPIKERIEILMVYVKRYKMSEEAELKFFDLFKVERQELLTAYISERDLSKKAIIKSMELPDEEKEKMLQTCNKFGKAPVLKFFLELANS